MEASSVGLSDFFRRADDARRRQGELLDRVGFGAQPTPSRKVATSRSAHLVAYQAPDSRRPAVLLVPAPIKTADIWDLAPGASVVQRCMAAKLQVYLIRWRRPQAGDEGLGLAEYADNAVRRCIDAIAEETGQSQAMVAGHSLGGTLAAIFASLHRDRVRALIALEAPIAFGAGRLEAAVATGPSASAITTALGNVPGSFLAWASACADPATFTAEPWLDWLQSSAFASATRLHLQVRRWSLDESPIAQRLFEEVAAALYRENRFASRRLHVGRRLADPRSIDMPILAVVDPRSRIVPRQSVDAYRTHTGSRDVEIIHYAGDSGVMLQHVGVLVGDNAHSFLWPRIVSWMQRQAHTTRRSGRRTPE